MNGEKFFTMAEYGPSMEEKKYKTINRKCKAIKYNKNGDAEFFCENTIILLPILTEIDSQNIGLWFDIGLCTKCLDNLSKEYKLDFKKEIPKLLAQKVWLILEKKLIEELSLKNSKEIILTMNLNKLKNKILNNYLKENNFPLWDDLNNLVKNNENKHDLINPEIIWFNDINYLEGIPLKWLKEFKLLNSTLQGSSSQGKCNGPDFIFEDINTKEKIGFEITTYKWNIFANFKNIEYAKEHTKRNIYNISSFDDVINEFKKFIKEKSNKNYVFTNKLYLGVVVNLDVLVDYQYYVLEIILNDWIKKENIKLDGVYIL